MESKDLIEKMLSEKADQNNTIDLNAYALGLTEMFNKLSPPLPQVKTAEGFLKEKRLDPDIKFFPPIFNTGQHTNGKPRQFSLIELLVEYASQFQSKQVIDWGKLRGEFFTDCTENVSDEAVSDLSNLIQSHGGKAVHGFNYATKSGDEIVDWFRSRIPSGSIEFPTDEEIEEISYIMLPDLSEVDKQEEHIRKTLRYWFVMGLKTMRDKIKSLNK